MAGLVGAAAEPALALEVGGGTDRRPSRAMEDEANGELVCLADLRGGVAIASATETAELSLDRRDLARRGCEPPTGELDDDKAACCCHVRPASCSGLSVLGMSHSSPDARAFPALLFVRMCFGRAGWKGDGAVVVGAERE